MNRPDVKAELARLAKGLSESDGQIIVSAGCTLMNRKRIAS